MPEVALSPGQADLLIQSVTDYAIYMLDPKGIVRSWNRGAERLKLYSAEEIIGEHFSRFYTEEDRNAGLPQRVLSTALKEGRFQGEGWRVRKDGTRFWANVVVDPIRDQDGRHVGFAKITRDLTQQREAQDALRRSEERFRLLVQGVTDYAIYMLDPTGHVSSWNAGAQRFKGYSADEIVGEHFSRFYLPEDREAGVPQRALETARKDGRFEAEGWRVRTDGTRFWANVVIDPIRDADGELIGFTKITRDLTERKHAQEALERAREQFFHSQKMEAIGQLTGGVAHDFNNILAAIMGSLSLAQRRMAEREDITRFLSNAMQAAQRGATLTQRMLAFARKQELKLEPVDVVAAVHEMAELLERTIGAGVSISTRFPLTLSRVLADRAQLELALMNLIVNARDAMPDGGTIELSGEEIEGSEGEGGFVRLCVCDEGEGMDPHTMARAVEPFFTTKGVGKGTGLGLPMVHGMAEQVGGRFEIESEPGKGTRAAILLPIAEGVDLPTSAPPPRAVQARSLRVLAVDDDPIVLLNTATMLADMGHDVLQAPTAAAAMAILQEQPVDVLVTDYAMPRTNGAELVRAAEQLRPGLKSIIVSGYADLPEGEALQSPRLSKPFTDSDLARILSDVAG
jgi:PAS domain S-box-containing protein